MTTSQWFLCGACLAAAMTASEPAWSSGMDDYEAAEFADGDQTLLYRLLKPKDYDPAKKYPLVLFLHGAGERGDDNRAPLKHVVRIFVTEENRVKYPCFVLVPQCPAGERWVDVDWGAPTHAQPAEPAAPMALTLKLLGALQERYSIDAGRLYVMGLSMGGYGTWDALARRPEWFAAAMPMCGGGDETTAARIAQVPIWNFHGAKDTAVKVERSRNMIEALRKAGGKPRYTEYPDVGHNCWDPACEEPELLAWLFAQRKPDSPR
jgi:predicted peptidase